MISTGGVPDRAGADASASPGVDARPAAATGVGRGLWRGVAGGGGNSRSSRSGATPPPSWRKQQGSGGPKPIGGKFEKRRAVGGACSASDIELDPSIDAAPTDAATAEASGADGDAWWVKKGGGRGQAGAGRGRGVPAPTSQPGARPPTKGAYGSSFEA